MNLKVIETRTCHNCQSYRNPAPKRGKARCKLTGYPVNPLALGCHFHKYLVEADSAVIAPIDIYPRR